MEVNGQLVDVPSYQVRAGDDVAVRAPSRELAVVEVNLGSRTRPKLPEWLTLDDKNRVARVVRAPTRDDIPMEVQEQLIVELYSK